ncbi:MAG TPA: Ig-like domain-containing protein [Mycobacteriales bacterium]|nr:Ig-like domain-containing protein [Mycobacteriales bacterium]
MSDRKRGTDRSSRILGLTAALAAGALTLVAACSAGPQGNNDAGGSSDQHQAAPAKNHDNHHSGTDKPSSTPTSTPTTKAPAGPAHLAVSPAANTASVSPRTPVTIKVTDGTLRSVRVTNAEGTQVTGKKTRTGWTSSEVLGYGKTYHVSAVAQNADGKTVRSASSFTTVTPGNYTAASISPSPAVDNVGTGEIITVTFDEPITDKAAAEKALKVKTAPYTVGAWRWMDDQHVEWRPEHYWKPGTRVTVAADIYGAEVGSGLFGQEDVSSTFRIHDDWHVNGYVDQYKLVVFHNNKIVREIPASFGSPSRPTHNGPHVISEKYHLYYMNSATYGLPADAPDGYSNFPAYWAQRISNGGEFVHVNDGTIYAQGHENVSHGCINVSMAEGKWLYDHLDIGDVVNVVGGSPQLPIWDGMGGWNTSFADWKAGSALAQSR